MPNIQKKEIFTLRPPSSIVFLPAYPSQSDPPKKIIAHSTKYCAYVHKFSRMPHDFPRIVPFRTPLCSHYLVSNALPLSLTPRFGVVTSTPHAFNTNRCALRLAYVLSCFFLRLWRSTLHFVRTLAFTHTHSRTRAHTIPVKAFDD